MANTVQVVVSVQDKASGALKGITGALSGMAQVAGGIIASNLIGRIGEGFATAALTGFDFNRSVENATAKLNAFTKDADISAGILETLREEAAKTPFAFEDMANAGAALLPVARQLDTDLLGLVRTAEVLAATNPAEGLVGATFALREAASGDFTSIIERFNLPRQAINQLKEEGVPNLEIVRRAMADMGYDMDLVANIANTFDGRVSTLKDTFQNLAGAFTQPIFNFLSEQIFGLQGTLDENMPSLEEKARNLGQFIADIPATIIQAWSGEWVDSDVIQPMHRMAGTLTQDVKAAWDGFNEAVQTGKDLWNEPWVQDDIVTPLKDLAGTIGTELTELLPWLNERWGELQKSGDALNDMLSAGRELWNTFVGLVDTLGINLGDAAVAGDAQNKAMKDASPLAETLITVFQGITKIASLMALGILDATQKLQNFIIWIDNAKKAWGELQAAISNAIPDGAGVVNGVPVGAPPDPNAGNPKGVGAPPVTGGATVTGGSGGRGMTQGGNTNMVQRGGDVFYITINQPMDWEEAAYQVQKVKAARA